MTYTRRIGALLALALTIVLAACSTSNELSAPTLEAQFGTAKDDLGIDVALTSTGHIYAFVEQRTPGYDPSFDLYDREALTLQRYDSRGNFIWSETVDQHHCVDGPCPYDKLIPEDLLTDAKGYEYVFYSVGFEQYDSVAYYMRKYNASGERVEVEYLGPGKGDFDATVDGSGNIYVAKVDYEHNYDTGTDVYTNVVAKYSTTGTLLWQRTSTVGTPYGITVSSSGSIYVVGSKGLARYSNSGSLTWTKSGIGEEVIISGSNIYTRYRKDIRKYDGNGKQLWLRTQSGLNTMVFQAMDGDGNGNVYLSGKYQASTGNMSAFVRKLNSSGSVLWTKTYGTEYYDDARAIATISGSEIYVTGETQGSLAHPNLGGASNRDAYLRKFSSSGGTVWTR